MRHSFYSVLLCKLSQLDHALPVDMLPRRQKTLDMRVPSDRCLFSLLVNNRLELLLGMRHFLQYVSIFPLPVFVFHAHIQNLFLAERSGYATGHGQLSLIPMFYVSKTPHTGSTYFSYQFGSPKYNMNPRGNIKYLNVSY